MLWVALAQGGQMATYVNHGHQLYYTEDDGMVQEVPYHHSALVG